MSAEIRRKLFFWMLVVAFFIITPTIIAYSFGYRYNNERGIFVYSGSITIKSNPTRISVDINGEPTSKKKLNYLNGSYHLDSLRPGNYAVTVKAPGYTSWTKEISVHSGVSTEFWNVILANEAPQLESYPTPHIEKFFPAPESHLYAYTTQNKNIFSVHTLNTESGESQQIFSSQNYTYTKELYKNIEWSPRSDSIIVPLSSVITNEKENSEALTSTPPTEQFAVINIESREIVYLHTLHPETSITSVRWSPNEKNTIYYLSHNDLMLVNIVKQEVSKILKSEVVAYDFSEDLLLTANVHTGIITSHKIENFDQFDQITTTVIENISECTHSCRLIAYDNDRIALIHSNGDFFLYNKGELETYPPKHLKDNVVGAQFSDDGKKLLLWTDHEIFVHFLREWDAQPYRNENETLHIARFFEPLSQVQWSKEYEHIIFFLNGKVQLIELDHRDKNNIQSLYSLTSSKTEIFSDFRDNKIYFTQAQESDNSTNLYSFEFPEKNSLLGL